MRDAPGGPLSDILVLAILLLAAALAVWTGLALLPAPLGVPANPSTTPNASRGPALQEALAYADAWRLVLAYLLPVIAAFAVAGWCVERRLPVSSVGWRKTVALVSVPRVLWTVSFVIGSFVRPPPGARGPWDISGLFEPWEVPGDLGMSSRPGWEDPVCVAAGIAASLVSPAAILACLRSRTIRRVGLAIPLAAAEFLGAGLFLLVLTWLPFALRR